MGIAARTDDGVRRAEWRYLDSAGRASVNLFI